MPRIAIFSDIHGNLPALEAVLDDLASDSPEAIFSLGDNIGYGPFPNEVVALLDGMHVRSVLGNHEIGILEHDGEDWFNPMALQALERTATLLSDATIERISTYPTFLLSHGCRFVHGAPPDDPRMYLFEFETPGEPFSHFPEPICFAGHTHELALYALSENGAATRSPLPEKTRLDPACRYLINAGSVGQPRDRDSRAKYLLFDPESGQLESRRVEYDIDRTVRAMREKDFPEVYIRRLQQVA